MSEAFRSLDPATEAVVWEGPAAEAQEVNAAVETARRSFPAWARRPLAERIAIAQAYRNVLTARRDAMAELIARETGKPLWETLAEVGSMIGKVDLSIAAQAERAGERHAEAPFGSTVLRHRPHGVMAVLGPYNFPGHLPNGHIVPALLAGNTVVFKPSELTPAVGAAMAAAWREAGLPAGVLSVVQGGRDTGAALVAADIDGLLCTGSATTGAHLRRVFADRPQVILALELGGNNPLVAWDGDIATLAAIAAESAFVTTGQRCSCTRRLIVPDSAFGNDLVEALVALAGQVRIGAWDEEPAPFIGPLISAQAAQLAQDQVAIRLDAGARAIRSLDAVAGRSAAFVTPAVIDGSGLDLPDDEIFAPVLHIQRARDFDHAIALANATRFGLSAGLLSEDDALWEQFGHAVRAGVINRNRPTTGASGALPFGGLGESGNHRPSGFYAADYCAYPVASFEAARAGGADSLLSRLQP